MVRRTVIVCGALALLLAVLVAAAGLFLRTEAGGRALAEAVAGLVSTPGGTEVQIAAIGPGLPSRLAVNGLVVRDAEGEWLAVDALVIDWRPLALLRGRISVREAAVKGVRFSRLPGAGPNAEATAGTAGLPTLPLDLEVESFTLDDVQVGAAVAGEPVDLRAHGRLAAATGGRVETAATVVRTNGAGGTADLAADWTPAMRELTVDARLDEPKGGVIGTALGFAGQPPVRLLVSGQGALDAWRGSISGDIGNDVHLDAELRSAATPAGMSAHLTGRADVAPLLGEALRPLAADGVTFAATLRRPGADALRVDALEVAAGGIRLTAAGVVRKEADRIGLQATAELAGLDLRAKEVAAVLSGNPSLSIDAVFEPETSNLSMNAVRLDAPALSLAGEGTVDLGQGDGRATVRGTLKDIAVLRSVTGLDLTGHAELAAEANRADGQVNGTFRLATDGLRTGLAPIDVLLGGAPSLQGRVSADPNGRSLRLQDLELAGDLLRADAAADLTDGVVSADYRARVADIGPAAAAAGLSARGALALAGTLTGDPADPSAQATVRFDDGRVETVAVTSARADIKAEALASAPRGVLSVDAAVEGKPVRARVPFAGTGDGGFRLGPFNATAPGAVASGTLNLPLEGGPVLGNARLRTGADGKPAAFAGYRLAGKSDTMVRLGAQRGEQTFDVEADGRSLALTMPDGVAGSAESATLRASLAVSPQGPRGKVDASATAVAAGGRVVDAFQAQLSGSAEAAKFSVAARVPGVTDGEVRLAGTAHREGRTTRVVVDSVDGRVGGEALALRQPLRIGIGDGGVQVEDLDLGVGTGTITAAGRSGTGGSDGTFVVRDLPLSVVRAIQPDLGLSGTVDAMGTVRTTGAALSGDLAVDVKDVHVAGMDPARAIDATVTARLAGGSLVVEAGSTIAGQPLEAVARIPVSVDAQSLAVRLAPQAPLSGRLRWAGPMAELWELLPLPDQRLTGQADVDLELAGTVADPRITGAAVLNNGRYENFVTATVIEGLAVRAQANGTGTVSTTLRGNDGERGTIKGDGTISLRSGGQALADLTVVFAEATLVRRDDVTATLSGTINVRQGPTDARISGRIVSDRVEVRLIDRLPPSVVVLDVKEINLPPGEHRSPPEEPGAPAWVANLDLAVSLPRRVFVRGRGLESEWQGDLRVTGTTAAPILTGSVSARSGVFDFAGRRFTIEQGGIGFAGGQKIDPTLNVVAVRDVADFTARITVTGTASAPAIALSSQPALPDSEILARVLFGKDVAKLGPVELAQLGLALDTLASGESLSEDALSYVRSLLGLDVLTVETGDEDGNGPAVGVGRYVADGVYVGARQGIDDDTTAGTVEVEILPGLSVESEVGSGDEGATGALGLRWRWDY